MEGMERIGATQAALQVCVCVCVCVCFTTYTCLNLTRTRSQKEQTLASHTRSSSLQWTTSDPLPRGPSLEPSLEVDSARRTTCGPLAGYVSLSLSLTILHLLSPPLPSPPISSPLLPSPPLPSPPPTQDLIKQPLLKKLLSHNEELQQKAVSSFLDILAYSCIPLYISVISSKFRP